MKTKEEILKMTPHELQKYKWSDDLDIDKTENKPNIDCSYCSYCSNCSNCSDCSNCSYLVNGLYCRNLKSEERDYSKYYICNIEVTKEEFEKKKKELKKCQKQKTK